MIPLCSGLRGFYSSVNEVPFYLGDVKIDTVFHNYTRYTTQGNINVYFLLCKHPEQIRQDYEKNNEKKPFLYRMINVNQKKPLLTELKLFIWDQEKIKLTIRNGEEK